MPISQGRVLNSAESNPNKKVHDLFDKDNISSTILAGTAHGGIDVAIHNARRVASATPHFGQIECAREIQAAASASEESARMSLVIGYDGTNGATSKTSVKFNLYVYASCVPTLEQMSTTTAQHGMTHISELESIQFPSIAYDYR